MIMNVCEIAFSTEWFLTIPGILITCGVILLIIALIMLLISISKGKKTTQQDAMNHLNEIGAASGNPVDGNFGYSNPGMENPTIPTIPDMGMQGQNSMMQGSMGSPVADVMTSNLEPVSSNTEVLSVPVSGPTVEATVSSVPPLTATPIEPVPSNVNVEIPTVQPVVSTEIPTESVVTPTPLETNINAFNDLQANTTPVVAAEPPKPIYGGANPLDATQNMPAIDVQHEPYSGGLTVEQPISAIESPTVSSTVETVSPAVEMPVLQPVEATPIPTVQTASVEMPKVETPVISEPVGVSPIPTVNVTDAPLETEKTTVEEL